MEFTTLTPLFVALLGVLATDQDPSLDGEWVFHGEEPLVEPRLSRTASRLGDGFAIRTDIVFESGVIEFDLATTGRRSFVGIAFRMESEQDTNASARVVPHSSSSRN